LDITNAIARASMDMASARVATEMQVAVMKKVMDAQQETVALLLKSLGVGQNLNIKA